MNLFMVNFPCAAQMDQSQGLSSRNDPNQNHDDRDDEKNMNQAPHGCAGDEAQQPENNQNDANRPQHGILLSNLATIAPGWRDSAQARSDGESTCRFIGSPGIECGVFEGFAPE